MNRDIPVLLIGFNRPELLKKRVQELIRENVKNLIISVDGCPELREEMQNTLNEIREICINQCQVSITLHEDNLGLSKHLTGEISKVLRDYHEVIVLEDDIEISENFLENMKRGRRILDEIGINGIVSAFSPVKRNKFLRFKNRWRITPYFNCWGWLCTREAWENYVLNISEMDLNSDLKNSSTWNELNKWQQFLWLSRFVKIQRTPYHTWDIQFQYMCFKNEMTNLSPIFTLTNNEGFDDTRSVHTKGKKPRWMFNGKVKSERVNQICSVPISQFFSKVIEPNTTAGDSRLIRIRNILRN
ncbi:hypothetical protein DLE04_00990 [Actinobacteria bacterium IMCC26103]|nr:hypothetical protein DLE04_00990 [Actinobacteria bacterium IMCC26103]